MNGPAHHSGADEVDAEVALWRSLFDAHPDPLMYLGCDFRVVRINAAQAKMLGCRVEEAAGRYCYELMHRGDGYVDDCPHARMLKEGGEQTAEYTFEGRDGCYRITVKPFTDPSGRLVGSLHVARDITAHKAMERDLREAHGNLVARVEERTQELNRRLLFDRRLAAMVQRLGPHVLNAGLMQLLDSEMAGLVKELGFDRCVLWVVRGNEARAAVRCENEAAQLPPLSDVVTRESGAWLFDVLEGSGFVKTSDQGVIRCAVPMAAPVAGSPAYLLLVMCREQTPGLSYLYEDTLRLMCEVLSGMLRHATDVAEAESLRVKLVQADRVARLGQVTATLAHELNQPLAAMLCNAQAADRLLSHADPDVREARLALADIVEAARCADAVIRNAHTLFRKEQLNRQPIDLNLLVTRVLRAYRWESALADAAVGIDLGAGLPPVLGNEIQLQQVVRNLLGNACDAVKENSIGQRLITVSTRRDEREGVELCVRDSGSGIPEGFEERIFVPFYTTKEGGLGMGLPICRQIVEKHGGSIRAERVPEGGSLFRIVLPPAMGPRSGASV